MTGDGDAVVVDEQLDVQRAGYSQAGCVGVVAFHLGAVTAEHYDAQVRRGHRDAVGERPDVTEAAGGEADAAFDVDLRMPVQAFAGHAVVGQVAEGDVAVEGAEGGLQRHPVTGFVEQVRVDRRAAPDETVDEQGLGHRRGYGTGSRPAQPLY